MQDHIFFQNTDLSLDSFRELCSQETNPGDYAQASEVQCNVVVYNAEHFTGIAADSNHAVLLKSELNRCLKDGPGVLVIRGAWPDSELIDAATEVFRAIIQREATEAQHRGDHFAKPGENERVWNALQKFCELEPETFANYYANPVLNLVCEAWLGPCFQMTSQVNIVKPGGHAQKPHRDYHLGFQDDDLVARFPISLQIASQYLTLQGAVAHSDMSVESGPTKLLPYSQLYPAGYMAWRHPDFVDYFEEHCVQVPLNKGDAVFFSPALFHSAGTNTEDTDRIANLLQVSVAFGKTMESVNWQQMTSRVYPVLLEQRATGELTSERLSWLMGSIADGYSFPTNLDSDPPINGSAPQTVQQLIEVSLDEGRSQQEFEERLNAACQRRNA